MKHLQDVVAYTAVRFLYCYVIYIFIVVLLYGVRYISGVFTYTGID